MESIDEKKTGRLSQVFQDAEERDYIRKLERIQGYLSSLTKIKIFFSNNQNFGHQTSSLTILYNLVELGFRGEFIAVYEGENVIDKLKVLFPISSINVPIVINIGDRAVRVSFTDNMASEHVELALTGGYDGYITDLEGLNADYIVRLKPYKWNKRTNEIYISKRRESIDLDDRINGLNGLGFLVRTPERDKEIWERFKGLTREWNDKIRLVETILDFRPFINVCPVYGINTWPDMNPLYYLFNLTAGIAYAQDNVPDVARKKTVVMIFVKENPQNDAQPMDNRMYSYFEIFLNNPEHVFSYHYIASRQIFNVYCKANEPCKSYIDSSALQRRIRYAYKDEELGRIVDIIHSMNDNEILIVKIGRVPNPVFNYIYSVSDLPVVFEGQSTAALAMNLGKIYFHIAKTYNIYEPIYPEFPNGLKKNNAIGGTKMVAQMAASPDKWKRDIDQFLPHEVLGKMMAIKLKNNPKSKAVSYFNDIKGFYGNGKNCKLFQALSVLLDIRQGG